MLMTTMRGNIYIKFISDYIERTNESILERKICIFWGIPSTFFASILASKFVPNWGLFTFLSGRYFNFLSRERTYTHTHIVVLCRLRERSILLDCWPIKICYANLRSDWSDFFLHSDLPFSLAFFLWHFCSFFLCTWKKNKRKRLKNLWKMSLLYFSMLRMASKVKKKVIKILFFKALKSFLCQQLSNQWKSLLISDFNSIFRKKMFRFSSLVFNFCRLTSIEFFASCYTSRTWNVCACLDFIDILSA